MLRVPHDDPLVAVLGRRSDRRDLYFLGPAAFPEEFHEAFFIRLGMVRHTPPAERGRICAPQINCGDFDRLFSNIND